jgi:protein-L-isoaspartate(D-aspartate) O-methyltransferase
MTDSSIARRQMVVRQIQGRGITSAAVIRAMGEVPREEFIGADMREFAYEDSPLPIGLGQTISQPYIVAYMIDALDLEGGERVLEVGTGSGYAAAVIARIAREVHTIERHAALASSARATFERLGYRNVQVHEGDGTRGWPRAAPYDAIVVAAGGTEPPVSLRNQLAIGGRLVIPVGPTPREQRLVRVVRIGDERFEQEELLPVRFVPLIGKEGWEDVQDGRALSAAGAIPVVAGEKPTATAASLPLPQRIAGAAEPFESIEQADLEPLLARVGHARLVLLGEASHGTAEFYRMRDRITRLLVERLGFGMVCIEADWPDARVIDHYVRHRETPPAEWKAFSRFPEWMWRNQEVASFVEWLRAFNAQRPPEQRVAFNGLDIYSLSTSIDAVLRYLQDVDPEAAQSARSRYGCLTPWESDPSAYGRMALGGRFRQCEDEVATMLGDMLQRRAQYSAHDGERYADAVHNARLVASAERYYRTMYYGSAQSWNLRDQHMFDTLQSLLQAGGADAKAVVWAHNSHLGDARHTEMSARGEHNVGQLCREAFGRDAYLLGFGTDHGTVAAADDWGGPMQVMTVRPSHPRSYEHQFHQSGVPIFLLPLGAGNEVRQPLLEPRLERAIGVIYRPATEMASHYFQAVLPRQFDEYCWFDETSAVRPLEVARLAGMPETYPFGL